MVISFNLIIQGYTDIFKIEDKIAFLMRMHEKIISKLNKKKDMKDIKFSYREMWEKMQEQKRFDRIQKIENLKKQVSKLEETLFVKEELFKIIGGNEEIKKEVIDDLNLRMNTILKWEEPLKSFVLQKMIMV